MVFMIYFGLKQEPNTELWVLHINSLCGPSYFLDKWSLVLALEVRLKKLENTLCTIENNLKASQAL